MKTITFASIKGGVLKTSSSISLAQILSEKYKVLLVDCDSNNAATSHFIEDIEVINNKTIRQVLKGDTEIKNAITEVSPNLFLLPSEIELSLIERELMGVSNQMFLLVDALREVENDFDFCIIDTGPSLLFTTKLAMISSDIVVIPTQLEKWAVRAINGTFIELEDSRKAQKYVDKKISKIVILPTQYEKNRTVKSVFLELLKKQFSEYLSNSVIHMASEASKTFSVLGDKLAINSRTYIEYKGFIEEILGVK